MVAQNNLDSYPIFVPTDFKVIKDFRGKSRKTIKENIVVGFSNYCGDKRGGKVTEGHCNEALLHLRKLR